MALKFKEIKTREPPKERSGHRIISDDNGFIYSFGGFNPSAVDISSVNDPEVIQEMMQKTLFKELWRFNPVMRQWKLLKTHGQHPQQVASHAAVCFKNHLIVYGGTGYPFGQTSTNKIYSCNLSTLEWTQLVPNNMPNCPNLPTEMYGQALVADPENDCLYCVGGTTGFTYSIEVHRFDLRSRIWTQLFRKTHYDDTEFPAERYRHEIVLYDEKIYVFGGGKSNTCCTLKIVPVFDLKTNSWSKIRATGNDPSCFPCKRKCHGCVVTRGNSVFILGGNTDKDICKDIWRFDLSTLTWTSITVKMPIPLFFFGITLAPGDKMYIFGGLSRTSSQNQLRVNKLYEMWLPVPPLQELAWQAVLNYACRPNERFTQHMQTNLLKLGLPRIFSDRLSYCEKEDEQEEDVNMSLITSDPSVGNSEILGLLQG